ncbi:hypothetical protein GCM10027299_21620 [Larkinella ripae]
MSTEQSYKNEPQVASSTVEGKIPALIAIKTTSEGNSVVSARELHKTLLIKRDFTTWCKQMFEYGFEVGKDYQILYVTKNGDVDNQAVKHSPQTRSMLGISVDYALMMDCAKEIAMIQRSEIGRRIRNYFIECERMALAKVITAPCNCSKATAKLEKKLDRVLVIAESYITPKVQKLDMMENDPEYKALRDDVMRIMTEYARGKTTYEWNTYWGWFWSFLKDQYRISIIGDQRRVGECTLDVAFRLGYGRQAWELAKTQFENK